MNNNMKHNTNHNNTNTNISNVILLSRNLLKYCYSNMQNVDVEPIECSALLSPGHIMEKLIQVIKLIMFL